jgi:hypothetical protein
MLKMQTENSIWLHLRDNECIDDFVSDIKMAWDTKSQLWIHQFGIDSRVDVALTVPGICQQILEQPVTFLKRSVSGKKSVENVLQVFVYHRLRNPTKYFLPTSSYELSSQDWEWPKDCSVLALTTQHPVLSQCLGIVQNDPSFHVSFSINTIKSESPEWILRILPILMDIKHKMCQTCLRKSIWDKWVPKRLECCPLVCRWRNQLIQEKASLIDTLSQCIASQDVIVSVLLPFLMGPLYTECDGTEM